MRTDESTAGRTRREMCGPASKLRGRYTYRGESIARALVTLGCWQVGGRPLATPHIINRSLLRNSQIVGMLLVSRWHYGRSLAYC